VRGAQAGRFGVEAVGPAGDEHEVVPAGTELARERLAEPG
jgi:hypothetical protein